MPFLDLLRPVSDEELRQLSAKNPGWQLERWKDGRLMVSPIGGESGYLEALLLGQLYRWNQQRGLGLVFSSATGFKLPDGSLLSPDAAFVFRDRWLGLSPEEREAFPPLAPDVALEIRSRSQTLEELRQKARAYLANGTRVVVLLDPYTHRVEVHRQGGAEEYSDPQRIPLDPELPGFTLDAQELFL